MKLSIGVIVVFVSGLLLAALPAAAQDSEVRSLKGLPGMQVVVEGIPPDAERDGLYRSVLQTDVESQLKAAGITVLTEEQYQKHPAMPYLYVNVNTVRSDPGLYAYSINISFRQKAQLLSGEIGYGVSTWETGSIGVVGASRLSQARESVKGSVDRFIKDWLTVNPKK